METTTATMTTMTTTLLPPPPAKAVAGRLLRTVEWRLRLLGGIYINAALFFLSALSIFSPICSAAERALETERV